MSVKTSPEGRIIWDDPGCRTLTREQYNRLHAEPRRRQRRNYWDLRTSAIKAERLT